MIDLIAIIFFIFLVILIVFHSTIHIASLFKENKVLEKLKFELSKEINAKGFKVILIDKPNKANKNKNPFRKSNDIYLPGFLPTGGRTFYRVIKCRDTELNEKSIWLEVSYSFYSKTVYRLSGMYID